MSNRQARQPVLRFALAILALTGGGLALARGLEDGSDTSTIAPADALERVKTPGTQPGAGDRQKPSVEDLASVRTSSGRSGTSTKQSWLLSSAMALVAGLGGWVTWSLRKKIADASAKLEGLSTTSAFLLGCASASFLN